MVWTNDDGLRVKFGTEEATVGTAGEYEYDGPMHWVTYDITGTGLADANAISSYDVVIPNGARITKVVVRVGTAFTSGGSAVLDVGLIDSDDDTSNHDDDALIAALALTSIDANGDVVEIIQGATSHGVSVGEVLTAAKKVTVGYDTAAFTAGTASIDIFYAL